MITYTNHCSVCGNEATANKGEEAYCPEHPDAMIDSVPAELDISGINFYRAGSECVAVQTGMPEQAVRIGTGNTPRMAAGDLQATPIQSAGSDAEETALRWAASHWEIGTDLESIAVTAEDLDDKMSAWE